MLNDNRFISDSLHLGCFAERLHEREFVISAGNYNTTELTPRLCASTCGYLSYNYSALYNGTYCLCGDSYGKYGASNNCNKLCPGDAKKTCGGELANNVYNVTPLTGRLTISSMPATLFAQINLTVAYTNGSVTNPGISVDSGQGAGFSPFSSSNVQFGYRTTEWGVKTIKAKYSHGKNYKTTLGKVKVVSQVKHVEIECPKYVKIMESFKCKVLVYQGTDMQVAWRLAQKGISENRTLAGMYFFEISKYGHYNDEIFRIFSNINIHIIFNLVKISLSHPILTPTV